MGLGTPAAEGEGVSGVLSGWAAEVDVAGTPGEADLAASVVGAFADAARVVVKARTEELGAAAADGRRPREPARRRQRGQIIVCAAGLGRESSGLAGAEMIPSNSWRGSSLFGRLLFRQLLESLLQRVRLRESSHSHLLVLGVRAQLQKFVWARKTGTCRWVVELLSHHARLLQPMQAGLQSRCTRKVTRAST